MKKIKVYITAAKWFDKVNGNTYHNAKITTEKGISFYSGYQYGYGRQYLVSAKEAFNEIYPKCEMVVIGETEFFTLKKVLKNNLF